MYRVNTCDLTHMPDPSTDQWLLPPHLRCGDDAGRQAVYREALTLAMDECLTPEQREALHQRFWLRKSIGEISAETGVTASAASKRIAAAIRILRDRIGFCVRLHDILCRKEDGAG